MVHFLFQYDCLVRVDHNQLSIVYKRQKMNILKTIFLSSSCSLIDYSVFIFLCISLPLQFSSAVSGRHYPPEEISISRKKNPAKIVYCARNNIVDDDNHSNNRKLAKNRTTKVGLELNNNNKNCAREHCWIVSLSSNYEKRRKRRRREKPKIVDLKLPSGV